MQKINRTHIQKLQNLMGVKQSRSSYEKKLLEKAEYYSKYFSFIPGVLCICVCNSVAMNTAHSNSDIDLFVITKNNRIWTTRLYLTLFCSLLGIRKNTYNHKGKFCLSFFITVNHLSLKKIALQDDIYLYYWLKTLIPIVDKHNSFESFILENKKWLDFENDYFQTYKTQKKQTQKNIFKRVLRYFGDIQEWVLKKIFLPKTQKTFNDIGKPFGVIIGDNILKFHNKDKRKYWRDKVKNY